MKKVIIIGGGLSGLIAAIRLTRVGFHCLLFEKKVYPFHRVCGEYISNETLEFLKREDLFPFEIEIPTITQFQLSAVSGKTITLPLDLGGFGISRFTLDHFLYQKALQAGVTIINEEVTSVFFIGNSHQVSTSTKTFECDFLIGAFGKRSKLDITTNRSFIKKRSPYVGVKYHIQIHHPKNEIALHNFPGGYCGISKVEHDKVNLCYLTHGKNLKTNGSIDAMEKNVLQKNPHLKRIFSEAVHLFKSPETINEISFETKEPIWNHMFNVGDAAGMITPLCGNGMAMAIHSAKLVSDILIQHNNSSRESIENEYRQIWSKNFAKRLWFGRFVQNKLFGSNWSSDLAINLAVYTPFIARQIIRNTHGKPF